MTLQEQIEALEVKRAALASEYTKEDEELTVLIEQGRAKAEIVQEKREKVQYLDHAISNLRAVIELEEAAEAPAVEVDPWGDAA